MPQRLDCFFCRRHHQDILLKQPFCPGHASSIIEKKCHELNIRPTPVCDPGHVERLTLEGLTGNLPSLSPALALPCPGQTPRLDDVTIKTIEDALSASKGKINGVAGAAERLGIHPNTLRNKMTKYGISKKDFGVNGPPSSKSLTL